MPQKEKEENKMQPAYKETEVITGKPSGTSFVKKWNSLGNLRGLIIGIVVLIALFSYSSDYFLTSNNIIAVLDQITIIGVLSLAMTFVILSGGIDLSVGSVVAMSAVMITTFLQQGMGMVVSVLLGILLATLLGAITGAIITKFDLQPFIVTLGTMGIARGIAMVVSDASPVSVSVTGFDLIGRGRVGVIPIPVIIFTVLIILSAILLKKTKFGEYVYAIGGNEEAARLAGIPVNFHKIMIYTLSGALAGFTGFIMASKFNSGVPTIGQAYELDAIAAVVIGGTALTGGIGGIGGTILGVIIMGLLNNGLNLIGVSTFWQYIIKGLLVIIAVIIDSYTRKKDKK
jgi:ribose/xylose/arabinose/galactoside ABC-type transport system permease subunit